MLILAQKCIMHTATMAQTATVSHTSLQIAMMYDSHHPGHCLIV